ncbi:hypothetical protein Aab01nite_03450 [Paractinoplanes abujensis]|nr:hypothetical protein Aab01nite_03450 [Actinoplanes abujensis]
MKGYVRDPEFRPMVERTVADGGTGVLVRVRGGSRVRIFTGRLLRPVRWARRVCRWRLVSVEGPLWMSGPARAGFLAGSAVLLEMVREVEGERSLLGASSPVVTVAVR